VSGLVLVIEDEKEIRDLVKYNLERAGFKVSAVADGDQGLERLFASRPDALVLDLMLPGKNGLEILREVRNEPATRDLPVIVLTARAAEMDKLLGFEHGADDYMVKPVRRQELLARVHALLRRAYPSEEKKLLAFPPFEIDTQRNEVRKEGAKVDLTPKEFELTVTLFRNIGRLMSRGHLQETVWGRSGDLATRTVDTHVSQVRKKLDLRPETGYRVVPIYNYGYRLEKITPP